MREMRRPKAGVGELKLIQTLSKSTNILLNHTKFAGSRRTSAIKFKKLVVIGHREEEI